MKKLLSVVIIGIVVLGGIGAVATAKNHNEKNSQGNDTTSSPYVDELDQLMTDFDGSFPIGRTNIFGFYANLTVAQSFIPQKELLTRTQFLMARNATTSAPCVLAVRDNLTGVNLTLISVEPSEFPVVNNTPVENQLAWIDFNFDDIWVTPGQTYYLVIYTTNITENYYWISGNGTNIYQNGSVLCSIDDGKTWMDLFPNADGCFKTYGLRETFLSITMNGGFPSIISIKNIGNYTAWDVTLNNTISGGLIFFGRYYTDTLSELAPGQEMTLRMPFILGFGKVTITLKVSAANVKEISSLTNATVILFFIRVQ